VIYLDHNATTPTTPDVRFAMADALERLWANPSSTHRAGQEARAAIEKARRSVADLINARPQEIVFTSGGTEAIGMAIRGALALGAARRRDTIVTSPVEHSAVRELLDALAKDRSLATPPQMRTLPIDADGVVQAEGLPGMIDERVALVVCQWANNETGAIQPVQRIAETCAEQNVSFLCDAAQWVGKGGPTDVARTPVDLLTIVPHKFGGPKGVAALFVRGGRALPPLAPGSQELGRRAGTENTPAIVGFGVACDLAARRLADPSLNEDLSRRRDRLEQALLERLPDASINGPTPPGARLPNTTNIAIPGAQAESLLVGLSEAGVAASAGSACASGSLEPSPVLLAMGMDPETGECSLRLSIGPETTDRQIEEGVEKIVEAAEALRNVRA